MSRTKRRNKRHLIQENIGDFSDFVKDTFHRPQLHQYRRKLWYIDLLGDYRGKYVVNAFLESKFHGCTLEQAYQRRVAAFTGDTRSGLYGVPRWYRQEFGSRLKRREEKAKLHKHIREDDWEGHLPDSRFRDTMYYWWY